MEELVPYIKVLLAGAGLYLGLVAIIAVLVAASVVAIMVSIVRNRPTGF